MNCVRLATLVLVAIASVLPTASGQQKADKPDANSSLEKQLFGIEQDWLKSEHDKNTDAMKNLAADQYVEILPGARIVNKEEIMSQVGKGNPAKPGAGVFADDFVLKAVYGNVALATDRTVSKGMDANGNIVVTREFRSLRIFVKENGKWKLAGVGLVPVEQK